MVAKTWIYVSNYDISCPSIHGIVSSQIETKRIFSLAKIFTNLKRCPLQSNNLNKFIFYNKNWPSETRVGCNSPFNLRELIENDVAFKEELKQYEGEFEWNELLD